MVSIPSLAALFDTDCALVYDLSLLASLPQSLLLILPASAASMLRPRSLFNVGVHDLTYLMTLVHSNPESNYIACTTDRILTMKSDISDILVKLPSREKTAKKVYPRLTANQTRGASIEPFTVMATQRDARRYTTLRKGLQDIYRHQNSDISDSIDEYNGSSDTIVEPLSWPLLAYSSFMWWASAGEERGDASSEEEEEDFRLLFLDSTVSNPGTINERTGILPQDQLQQPPEITLITYFRHITSRIFAVLVDAISRQIESPNDSNNYGSVGESDNDPLLSSPGEDQPIIITSSDMAQMGLDVWSPTDKEFVEQLVNVWFGRKAEARGAMIKCCGIRIL